MQYVHDKVAVALAGTNGNGVALIATWRRAAREQGWSDHAVDAVTGEAMAGDYGHLLSTLAEHTDQTAIWGDGPETDPTADIPEQGAA